MSEHQRLVCKLYKQAINTTKDWVHDRRAYRIYALCIRAAFDRRKEETNTEKIELIVAATKKILLHWKHDNPIVCMVHYFCLFACSSFVTWWSYG